MQRIGGLYDALIVRLREGGLGRRLGQQCTRCCDGVKYLIARGGKETVGDATRGLAGEAEYLQVWTDELLW